MSLLKLQQMIDSGKTYYYRDQPAVIKSYESRSNGFEILVEIYGKPSIFIKENEEKISLFLECFKELPVVTETEEINHQIPDLNPLSKPLPNLRAEEMNSQVPAMNKPKTEVSLPLLFVETRNMFSELAKGLIADSEKVRQHPEYIPQAKQVCNNVNAIVNIARLQFQLIQQKQ